ncbi:MAG: TetR/AcrR family transcriptional regulator [Gammaproteobacteria bacterium]|tara:strand:+ start:494 stop:1090 length:597 start_codon:yes stop_codon:yes gene_type:complete
MGVSAKQERSKLRVAKIIEAAHQILLTKNTEDITISNLAIYSDLKRTSTYKFFANPDDVKELLVQRYIQECSQNFLQTDNQDIYDDLSKATEESVIRIFNFFSSNIGAQKLILQNTVSPPVQSETLHQLASQIISYIETNIKLPAMFNKEGVFLVMVQIIISILSLNIKENGELNQIGKSEAHRASYAYLLSCIAQKD